MRRLGHHLDAALLYVLLRLRLCCDRMIRAAFARQDAREIASLMEVPTCGRR